MRDVTPLLIDTDFPAIHRGRIETLQMNLGYLCNLSCSHCHVNAGPKRTELMSRATMLTVLQLAEKLAVTTLDLTGGSPEMNPEFRWLVATAGDAGYKILDRLNPTILVEPGYRDMAPFMARHQVELTPQLPCYLEENVDKQRGKGVFSASIEGLRQLNDLGYGLPESGLVLNLVYNPQDAVLPPAQEALEQAYRAFLRQHFNIEFNRLYVLTNMPIQRFGAVLWAKNQFYPYLELLQSAYQADNLDQVMCKRLLSIDWQGFIYDCDFNQMLNLPVGGETLHVSDLLENFARLSGQVKVGNHCYGCTAGQGSSCTGVLRAS